MADWIWPAALGLLGGIVGSFLATLVIRWPQGRSVVGGRSACDGCGRTLAAWELVPLLNAVALRGVCGSCGTSIDKRHWLMELACTAIGFASGIAAPGPVGAAGAVFGWLLVTLAALDVAEFWLPDILTGTLALAALASIAIAPPLWSDRLIGGAAGFASLWLIALAYRRIRGREGLGGGDPKLFGAIGLWIGWAMLPFVLLLGCMIGLGAVLAARLRGEKVSGSDAMPLGALMAIAAYPVWLVMIAFGP
ncbi:A24 family peptidase [Sphingomonas sp.]|jgi:leader peptidase (prepilin peptidase)/N-methyltransferase|uniref:prepilin peptidase n=1 Tax=Sphingomonas sp. TaxID=28214 RepID=UPI002E30859F|nr:A24 family peptidase [Sphingomonas sp.]HEX4694151.1 A24 family peptidase [Sphingomonas sp.]